MPTNKRNAESAEPTVITPTTISQVQFLTVAEVAKMMRVSKMTVYRLVHSGEMPAVRVGKSFRVPEKAVHTYLENAYFDAG
jgi:excisionase family DNA binding protein